MDHKSSKQKEKRKSSSQANVVKLQTRPPNSLTRFDPLTAFSTPDSSWKSTAEPSSPESHHKGKAKATGLQSIGSGSKDQGHVADQMWVDIYEPSTEAELAVHKKKVEDVRRWLSEAFYGGPSGTLMKYRRLLVLTGPAGTGKTATLRVLAKEMGFEIMEWRNTPSENTRSTYDDFDRSNRAFEPYSSSSSRDVDGETPFSKFEVFMNRASSCSDLFKPAVSDHVNSSQKTSQTITKRHIILLEDLPNILHIGTQTQFHATLQALVASPVSNPPIPVVIVISDAGIRGEANDQRTTSGQGWDKRDDGIVDIRTVLPRGLLGGPYVTQIGFNPIAPTLLLKALQALVHTHSVRHSESPLSREVLDTIVQSANGDIRSAIMTAQFACITGTNDRTRKNKKVKLLVLDSVTRREQSLVLFHLLGKVLYNRRKGDPPSSSASAKDILKEKAIDAQIKDPPKLPLFLQEHERRASRIDVDMLYADSPIDSSLFSLYIHQNYTQFCDDIEHCDGIADWLSWVDSSGGDTWYQANPHRFHLVTMGTLHSLPSPVTRRSQKFHKPAFFEYLAKEKKAREAVRDVHEWILQGSGTGKHNCWGFTEVAVELSSVLQARDGVTDRPFPRSPPSHHLFSALKFMPGASNGIVQILDDKEIVPLFSDAQDDIITPRTRTDVETDGGWLESDDIEEF